MFLGQLSLTPRTVGCLRPPVGLAKQARGRGTVGLAATEHALHLHNPGASSQIVNTWIGLDITGDRVFPNGNNGMYIESAVDMEIGADDPQSRVITTGGVSGIRCSGCHRLKVCSSPVSFG